MLNSLFADNFYGLHFVFRFLHVFFGIIWIGHLYYFNFVQGAFMNETDAGAKSQVLQKLAPRALWWFRWGAMWTFVTGVMMLMLKAHQEASAATPIDWSTPYWVSILTGSLFATLMFLNVWLIIWPNQKIVIANAVTTAGGAAANPAAAGAGGRALVASRTNTMFSVPMLFFMLAANHFGYEPKGSTLIYWIAAFVVIGALELNAIKGKTGPMTTIKGVIGSGFALLLVMLLLNTILL